MSTEPHGVARDQLRAFIERVERVEEEIASLNTDKSDIYKEARAVGFDVKVLRKVVAKRKLETHVREEQDAIFDMYWEALYGAPVHVHTHVRENIEENRRSDAGLNIVTKHEDIRTAPVMAEESPRKAAEAVSERTAFQVGADASAEAGVSGQPEMIPATSAESAGEAAGSASDLPTNSQTAEQAGGEHEVATGNAERVPTSNTGEGAANTALPAKSSIRPLCRNPGETCGGYGRKHCRACEMAAAELEAAE